MNAAKVVYVVKISLESYDKLRNLGYRVVFVETYVYPDKALQALRDTLAKMGSSGTI